MCAWADAAILTAVPVKQVVPAAVARARKVADLILFIPGRLKPPDRIKIEIRRRIGVGQIGRRVAVKSGTGFNFQQIGRDMVTAALLQKEVGAKRS